MCSDLSPGVRLSLLSRFSARPWASLEEERRCILCDAVFSGSQVRVVGRRSGQLALRCPTPECRSRPEDWVHPDNPLLSLEAWADWDSLIQRAGEVEPEETVV
jgi:hypothetical protein